VKFSPLSLPFAFVLLAFVRIAPAADAPAAPVIPPPPEIAAKAYILIDYNSGQVLAESHADERLEPASLTKIMTAYLTFRALKEGTLHLDDMVTVSQKAWKTEGSRMFANLGAQIAVENLLKGMIVQSGNDASVALAERIGGDEAIFVDRMNEAAARLGMANTRYANSMGLPNPDHYSTARDLARLTRALISEFPEYYKWHSIKEFEFNKIKQINRNKLLWRDPTVDGVKTGHTNTAGYCLVSSALRDNMRLIAVVLGTKSENERANANQALLNYGYRYFETKILYKAGDKLAEPRIWKGAEKTVPAGPAEDFYVTFPRGQYLALKASMEMKTDTVAPVKKGDKLGSAKVNQNGALITERDLVALQDVPEGGIFRRLFDAIAMKFR
jgi:D-alanyl-D-alanine carboxypeptidase (penicillin-binding protein 5/6)